MALTAEQEVIVSEIIEKPLAFVQAAALTDEQITRLSADLTLWDLNRNKVKVELTGNVDLRAQRLLDAIRRRVKKMYGLSDGSDAPASYVLNNQFVF